MVRGTIELFGSKGCTQLLRNYSDVCDIIMFTIETTIFPEIMNKESKKEKKKWKKEKRDDRGGSDLIPIVVDIILTVISRARCHWAL